VSSTLASCTDARLFCAVFRYARQTFAAWPGDLVAIASFLTFLARRRSWVFLRPSQVCSRGRVSRHLWRSGPTCRFARRVSDPIYFRRADRSRAWWRRGRPRTFIHATFDFWASLPSAIRIPKPHLIQLGHGIDPASGFASCRVVGACLRMRSGSTPIESSASGIPRPADRGEPARPYPLMGLQPVRRLRTGARAVPSAY